MMRTTTHDHSSCISKNQFTLPSVILNVDRLFLFVYRSVGRRFAWIADRCRSHGGCWWARPRSFPIAHVCRFSVCVGLFGFVYKHIHGRVRLLHGTDEFIFGKVAGYCCAPRFDGKPKVTSPCLRDRIERGFLRLAVNTE